ncbi:unnamed protein product [Periconia digitata]|uniref:Altered inheritance of mitochondria protein 11 n=1 Tax=Periconia digitata TaxID=1303443 RepID=A0A9W4UJW5_9PLEO|nr:unnamed protein product [Periconia digitata]
MLLYSLTLVRPWPSNVGLNIALHCPLSVLGTLRRSAITSAILSDRIPNLRLVIHSFNFFSQNCSQTHALASRPSHPALKLQSLRVNRAFGASGRYFLHPKTSKPSVAQRSHITTHHPNHIGLEPTHNQSTDARNTSKPLQTLISSLTMTTPTRPQATQPQSQPPSSPPSSPPTVYEPTPWTSPRSLRQLSIFCLGATAFLASTALTRRSIHRRSLRLKPQHFSPNTNPHEHFSPLQDAIQALNLATLNCVSVGIMGLGGTLWAFDVSGLSEAREALRKRLDLDTVYGGQAGPEGILELLKASQEGVVKGDGGNEEKEQQGGKT